MVHKMDTTGYCRSNDDNALAGRVGREGQHLDTQVNGRVDAFVELLEALSQSVELDRLGCDRSGQLILSDAVDDRPSA